MRLFLHGRHETSMLIERIRQADEKENCRSITTPPPSVSSLTTTHRYYSSLLLSNWNVDQIDTKVLDALARFLTKTHCTTDNHYDKQHEIEQREDKDDVDENDHNSVSQIILRQSSLVSELSDDEPPEPLMSFAQQEYLQHREVILHNCEGGEMLADLVVLLMGTNATLTIRYDKQRNFPGAIAAGLFKGASGSLHQGILCPLRSLTLKGMTLTPKTAKCLERTLPLLPNLQKLALRGNFTLADVGRNRATIFGNDYLQMASVAEALHETFRSLPCLRNLDLGHCHLPDEYLADILEALHPSAIASLNLNGNTAREESMHVLCNLLSHPRCVLKHLDLSWQRLPHAQRNYSVLDVEMLATVLERYNDSLHTLNLSENRLLDMDVAHLAVAFSKHLFLAEVRLQDCHIGEKGMMALARELPRWPEHLQHVHIDGDQSIRRAKTTRSLRDTIFRSVLQNVYLKELALPSGLQSDSTDWAIQLNKAGRRALLDSSLVTSLERDCPDPAIECTLTSAPSFDSQTGTNHICDALWPVVLERADHVARYESNREEDSNTKAASALFLLLREKGYRAMI